MHTADQFRVQTNIKLVFDSKGRSYTMKLLIDEGLVVLTEKHENKVQVLFLGEQNSYYGAGEIQKSATVLESPKRKRSKKKKT